MEKKYKQIIEFLKHYQETQDCKGYIIGISGGKDSTVVAKLLCDAIGKENVFGVLMPNGIQSDIADSLQVCELLDIDYQRINIGNIYKTILEAIKYPDAWYNIDDSEARFKISDKTKTNIPPRIRMTVLYTLAQTMGYRVAGTGNASESYVGWFTKWGDGACDINPIAHLTCTEVIALGDYLDLPKNLVHKTPADGLTGKSDEENLGMSYGDLDGYIRNGQYPGSVAPVEVIETLHKLSRHKFAPIIIEE